MHRFFRNSFRIYKSDLKRLSRNWVAIIIVFGLAVLPSLYAWINILVSWDPYGNTSGVKIGIVNEDEGSTYNDISVDVGKEVVDELKNNKKLGWTFYDSSYEGIKMAEKGTVYATIIIPQDFSRKILTVVGPNPEKPQLEYYVNEKINAVAPKMTDAGATTLQRTITNTFASTVVQKIFDILNPLGADISSKYGDIQKLKSFLYLVDNDFPQLNDKFDKLINSADKGVVYLNKSAEDVDFIKSVMSNAIDYSNDIGDIANRLIAKSDSSSADIKTNLQNVSKILDDIQSTVKTARDDYSTDKPDIISKISGISDDLSKMRTRLEEISDEAKDFDADSRDRIVSANNIALEAIDKAKESLTSMTNQLDSLDSVSESIGDIADILNDVIKAAQKLQSVADDIFNVINTQIKDLEKITTAIENNESVQRIQELIKAGITEIENTPLFTRAKEILESMLNNLGIENKPQLNILDIKLSTVLESLRSSIQTKHDNFTSKLDDVIDMCREMRSTTRSLSSVVSSAQKNGQKSVKDLQNTLSEVRDKLLDANDLLQSSDDNKVLEFAKDITKINETLKTIEDDLNEFNEKYSNKNYVVQLANSIIDLTTEANRMINLTINEMDDYIVPKIQQLFANVLNISRDVADYLNRSMSSMDTLKDFLNDLSTKDKETVEDLKKMKDDIPNALSSLKDVSDKIKTLSNLINLDQLTDLMQGDADTEGDFFGSPVNLITHKLFNVKTYGAGMTPFYTTLCLWVGALILSAIISVESRNADFEFTPNEEFIGKYMLFATLAMLQGFIASMGDIYILKIDVMHKALFVVLSVYYSLVFSMMIYSLVAILHNVGKALGVVILVFQIGGSGGTFPIEVTPMFFQKIYKFLPFTYGIGGLREALAGIVYENLVFDIIILFAYFLGFFLLGILLKRFASKGLVRFKEMLEKVRIFGE